MAGRGSRLRPHSLTVPKPMLPVAGSPIQKGEIYINNFEIISRDKNFDLKKKTRSIKKLLLNKREIKKILGMLTTKGFTAVPMEIFFNDKGLAKVRFGVGVGKKKYDKRETIKQREWDRKKQRIIKK